MLDGIDMTVVTNIRGNSCGALGAASYMVNDTSPYAMICTFVRYYDPKSAYGDIPIILLFVDSTNKGASATHCFSSGGPQVGFLMFSPNTPGVNGGGQMTITDLATVLAARVQFSIISNTVTPVKTFTPVWSTSNLCITGPEVVINYMDSTRLYPQPVCIIPTTSNYDGIATGSGWTRVQDAVSTWGMQGDSNSVPLDCYTGWNNGLQFGLFGSPGPSDLGYNRSFSYVDSPTSDYTGIFHISNLEEQNAFDSSTMSFGDHPLGSGAFSSLLFQLVVSPWYKTSQKTFFPPRAGLSANPWGFHSVFDLRLWKPDSLKFKLAVNGSLQTFADTSTYAPMYTYSISNSCTAVFEIVDLVHIFFKLFADSNLPGGAFSITDSTGNLSYGEPLGICQSLRLEADTLLESIWLSPSTTSLNVATSISLGEITNPDDGSTILAFLCFNAFQLLAYCTESSPVNSSARHYIRDVNLIITNNTGFGSSPVTFMPTGQPPVQVPLGSTYSIPFNQAYPSLTFTLEGVSYTLAVALSGSTPELSGSTQSAFTATTVGGLDTTNAASWCYHVNLAATAVFFPLDLTAAFNDLAFLQPGSMLQVSGASITTKDSGGNYTNIGPGAVSAAVAYYFDVGTLSRLVITYADGSGTPMCSFQYSATHPFFTTTSALPALSNRLAITQSAEASAGYALAVSFYYFENNTTQDMVLKVPNPLGVSRSVPVSKASKIQVAANDFAYLEIAFV